MKELTFGFVIFLLVTLPTLFVWSKKKIKPFEQVLAVLFVGVSFLLCVFVIAPPLYRFLLDKNPLLFARVLLLATLLITLGLVIGLGVFFFGRGALKRLRERISRARYLDQKLSALFWSILLIVMFLAYLLIPTVVLVAIARNWNDVEIWSEMAEEMRSPPEDARLIDTSAMVAARDTCLYQNSDLSGPCSFPQSGGSYVFLYWSLELNPGRELPLFEQRGEAIYVLSFDPDTVLEPGWVHRSHYRPSADVKDQVVALLRSLVSRKMLGSLMLDLLIGSLITWFIVWRTKGAAEHYLLFLVSAFSLLSMAIRYSIGGMIIPTPFILVAIVPLVIGSIIEDSIIRLLRKVGR